MMNKEKLLQAVAAAALVLAALASVPSASAKVVPLKTDELEAGRFADSTGWDPRWVDRDAGFYGMIWKGDEDKALLLLTAFTGGSVPGNPKAQSSVSAYRVRCPDATIAWERTDFFSERYGRGSRLATENPPKPDYRHPAEGTATSLLLHLKCDR